MSHRNTLIPPIAPISLPLEALITEEELDAIEVLDTE